MKKLLLHILLLTFADVFRSSAFVKQLPFLPGAGKSCQAALGKSTTSVRSSSSSSATPQTPSLSTLRGDTTLIHLSESLSDTITSWLDTTYLPQEIHKKIAETSSSAVTEVISKSEDVDVTDAMLFVIESLEKRWDEVNADAFVNPFDVGCFVSEFLIAVVDFDEEKTGSECENKHAREGAKSFHSLMKRDSSGSSSCSEIDKQKFLSSLQLESEFDRFKWISQFLDGDDTSSDFIDRANKVFEYFFTSLTSETESEEIPPLMTTKGNLSTFDTIYLLQKNANGVEFLPDIDDDEANESLWDVVKARQGETAVQMKLDESRDNEWIGRATVVRFLCWNNFLSKRK